MKLYKITANVDNGVKIGYHRNYFVMAETASEAKEKVSHYWNSQYDMICAIIDAVEFNDTSMIFETVRSI